MTLAINDLTAGPDSPPTVEILLTDLSSDVAKVTAYRLANGVEQRVSGVIGAAVTGAGTWVDFEVPAQQATYRVEMFDDEGISLGFTEQASIELGFSGIWMHNPLSPSGAVRVQLVPEAGRVLSRPTPGRAVQAKGRSVGIMVTGPRLGLQGAVFSVMAPDARTADRIQAFLGGPSVTTVPVVCIRVGVDYAGVRVGSPLFLGVPDIPEEDLTFRYGGTKTIQHITGSEAARPAPGIFIPLLRRKDMNAFYASRAAFNAAYLTRLSANRDYGLAGYAGD